MNTYRNTLLAATLYGHKTGGKGSKLIPNILIITGTLREKLVQLFQLFLFHTSLLKLKKHLKMFIGSPEL